MVSSWTGRSTAVFLRLGLSKVLNPLRLMGVMVVLALPFAGSACGGDPAAECSVAADCGEGLLCEEGVCAPPPATDSGLPDATPMCLARELLCDGECVDPRSDPQHCGGCGGDCGDTPGATATCNNMLCTTACDEGFADCDGEESNGCEADISGDDDNCGACGVTCDGGSCVASTCLLDPRGDGSSGAFSVDGGDAVLSSIVTTANGGAGRPELILTDPTGFLAGQLILLHQTRGPDAGRFELHRIDSIADGAAILTPPLGAAFATGAGSIAQAIVVPQYTDLSVTAGRVTAPSWDGTIGGIVAIAATGAVTIAEGASIDVAGRGFRGGSASTSASTAPGIQGEGELGLGTASRVANGSGGGAGQPAPCNRSAGGGGGAGGSAGGDGMGVCSEPTAGGAVRGGDASAIFGGGGGTGGPYNRPGGGAGGGAIFIFATSLVVEGRISADGLAGGAAVAFFTTTCAGPGGGGAGGSIFVDVDDAMLGDAFVTAAGGAAGAMGAGICAGLAGGAGGAGRVSVRGETITGVTNPPAITP